MMKCLRTLFVLCAVTLSSAAWAQTYEFDYAYKQGAAKSSWTNCSEEGWVSANNAQRYSRYSGKTYTGDVMSQTVSGIPNGEYTVEVYCAANLANWDNNAVEESLNGSTECTIYDINSVSQGIPFLYDGKSLPSTGMGTYTFNKVSVTDGTMAFKITNNKAAANWISTNIKSMKISVPLSNFTDGMDVTGLIANPNMEFGTTGWTCTSGIGKQNNNNLTHNYLQQWNSNASNIGNASISQTITLPKGLYKLSAQVCATNLNATFYAKVGENNAVEVTTDASNQENKSLNFSVENESATVEIGYKTTGAIKDGTSGWFAIDNVSLYYYSGDVDALIKKIPEGKMNADVEKALTDAKTALEADKTNSDKYSALLETIEDANASIEAYKTAADVLPKMKALTESTNFYTTDAYNTYYGQWKKKYDEGTLTNDEANALQDPTTRVAWSARNNYGMAPKFLLDAWDDGGTFNDAGTAITANGDYLVNTWSVEGDQDGSNFAVPFFQYWIADASTLGAKTLTGTISGLTAGQTYSISAWVRVRLSDAATEDDATPSGISLYAGENSVDVSAGSQIGSSKLYIGEYSVLGTADNDGNLTIKFVVADGNNISWLAFKNVNYQACETVTFDEDAVEDGVYYATYTTKTAVDLSNCDFKAYSVSVSGTTVNRTELTGVVPANTPLLLSASKAGTYVVAESSETGTDVTTDLKSSDGTVTGNETTFYALGIGNKSKVLGWYLLSKEVKMTSGKCYLVIEAANGAKFIGFDGDATGINAVSNSTKATNAVRYNMSGQRVNGSYKGIVIENGNKYLVK